MIIPFGHEEADPSNRYVYAKQPKISSVVKYIFPYQINQKEPDILFLLVKVIWKFLTLFLLYLDIVHNYFLLSF